MRIVDDLDQYRLERRERFERGAMWLALVCTLSALAALLWPFAAHAQLTVAGGVVDHAAPSGVGPFLLTLLSQDWAWRLLELIAGLVGAKLLLFLHAKEGESKVAKVVAVFGEAAKVAVLEVEQRLRPQLQSVLADGVVTPAEAAELKAAALDIIKTRLPGGALAAASSIFGPLLDGWLSKQVEAAHAAMPADLQFQPPPPGAAVVPSRP